MDIDNLESVLKNANSWDDCYNVVNGLTWAKWPIDKKVTLEIKDISKKVRDDVKKKINSNIEKFLFCNSEEAMEDIFNMHYILKELEKLVNEFSIQFAIRKKEKNIIDFNDIEHFALKILIKKDEGTSKFTKTEIAKNYEEKFKEILVDEYQDSNLVQEYILNSISKGNNMFMVGDVKQSIYKFRQARPELFLEKYEKYPLKESQKEENLKIQLFKNFRSRKNVLDITNLIFQNIMSKEAGDINYNQNEYLNLGANYEKPKDKINYAGIAEINIIDLKEQEDEEEIYIRQNQKEENCNENNNVQNSIKENCETKSKQLESDKDKIRTNETEENEETENILENSIIEARFVAKRIKELIDSNYMVYDKNNGYRKISYKDIVILLRTTSSLSPIFEKELIDRNIPVFSDSSSEFLESIEIQTILSVLKILDNPTQEIPLITVMRSNIGMFSDEELIKIRIASKDENFYMAMIKAKLQVENSLSKKITEFLEKLSSWRKKSKIIELDELIWLIYTETNFYHYVGLMPNGAVRQANLKKLFEKAKQYEEASFKGLYNFIHFIDKVHAGNSDIGSAKIIGENEDVVRIMSIHKSKGLEFPVVFLSGTGKGFNLRDLNEPILLHQDIGFGVKYIDEERKIEYSTLAKEAIRIKSHEETISEEMRILYVALTRAKEKLIITGLSKDVQKSLRKKEELLEMYSIENNENKINSKLIKKYKTYLDWIELVYKFNMENIDSIACLNIYTKNDILKHDEINKNIDEEKLIDKINKKYKEYNIEENENQEILKKLNWKYNYLDSINIPTKTSVSKLKEIEQEKNKELIKYLILSEENDIDSDENIHEYEEIGGKLNIISNIKSNLNSYQELDSKLLIDDVPKFLKEEEKITSSKKGTLMHLCMQKMVETKNYSIEDIKSLIQNLEFKNIISEKEAEAINISQLFKYTKSELWKELGEAKEIYKEQPFYLNIKASDIMDVKAEDFILVQGIIDLYYINKDNELILVDYKTDYLKEGEEKSLVIKYKKQLELYKRALETSLGRDVVKTYIYSTVLNKNINIEI